jgi:hypothetical protein
MLRRTSTNSKKMPKELQRQRRGKKRLDLNMSVKQPKQQQSRVLNLT